MTEDGVVRDEGRAEREERNERDVVFDARVEHRLRSPVDEVVRVLHADDLGAVQRDLQMLNDDAAQPDSADEPFVAGLDHRVELTVEQLAVDRGWLVGVSVGILYPEVDRGQPVGLQGAQVLLDAEAWRSSGSCGGSHAPVVVAARTDLADTRARSAG